MFTLIIIAILITIILSVSYYYSFDIKNAKLYRKIKGGIWYRYFPKQYPYMSFYTNDKTQILENEIIEDIEKY